MAHAFGAFQVSEASSGNFEFSFQLAEILGLIFREPLDPELGGLERTGKVQAPKYGVINCCPSRFLYRCLKPKLHVTWVFRPLGLGCLLG